MTDRLAAIATDPTDLPSPEDLDLPAEWTDSARETFEAVYRERPEMSAAEVAALWQACALESAADRLDEIARDANMTATGSTGQTIVHPAVAEARMARTQAAAILARLVPPAKGGAMTNSQRGQAAARARWGGRR